MLTLTTEMLYIPARERGDSCTVWTANNTPLQWDSETLYWFPSLANIDRCWQLQSSHGGDTRAWHKHRGRHTSSGFLKCAPRRLVGAGRPSEHNFPLVSCQSDQGQSRSLSLHKHRQQQQQPRRSVSSGQQRRRIWSRVKWKTRTGVVMLCFLLFFFSSADEYWKNIFYQ